MSDVMLLGVLRAPYPETPLALSQLVQRARQAADAIEARDAEIAALRAEIHLLRILEKSLPVCQKENDGLRAAATSLVEQNDSLRAEVERLREAKDGAYLERNRCVALIARMALAMGLRAGLARTAIEGWSDDWHGCVYINLPTGQCSWHFHDSQAYLFDGLPAYAGQWDGHTTPQKYERVDAAMRQEPKA